MLRWEEGGASPALAVRACSSPGFVCPRSGARASGTGCRSADKGRAPRGRCRANSSAPLGSERDPGGESARGSFPALLNNGAPAPHPGGDWAGTPAMGEGGSSEAIELSIASAARESLLSALRGLRCHSHFRDGETEAFAEGLVESRPTPSPGTCCGPGAVPGSTSGLETRQERKVQTSCVGETGSRAHFTRNPAEKRTELLVSCCVVLWPERSFSPQK